MEAGTAAEVRENGLYWVRHNEFKWEVAHWKDGTWILLGTEAVYEDAEMVQIDRRKLTYEPVPHFSAPILPGDAGYVDPDNYIDVPNKGMDLSSIKDGKYLVRADGQNQVVAKFRGGMWFRADGESDGILWFRPTSYKAV